MLPTLLLPPLTPLTCHVTPVLEPPVTEAVNCCVFPATTLAVVGLTATVIGWDAPGETVTAAPADLVLSAALTAVTVTDVVVVTAGAV